MHHAPHILPFRRASVIGLLAHIKANEHGFADLFRSPRGASARAAALATAIVSLEIASDFWSTPESRQVQSQSVLRKSANSGPKVANADSCITAVGV